VESGLAEERERKGTSKARKSEEFSKSIQKLESPSKSRFFKEMWKIFNSVEDGSFRR
jgi:hypothetical protein